MLKTNAKKTKINVMKYIRQDLDYLKEYLGSRCEEIDLNNDKHICTIIWDIFTKEMSYELKKCAAVYDVFVSWAQGLALGQLFCYYYNRSAVDDLAEILEETDEEKSKYLEFEAEELLTKLIFRTIQEQKSYSL